MTKQNTLATSTQVAAKTTNHAQQHKINQNKKTRTQTTNRQSMGNTQTIDVKTNKTGACAEREEKTGRKEGNARDASRVVSRGFSKGTET